VVHARVQLDLGDVRFQGYVFSPGMELAYRVALSAHNISMRHSLDAVGSPDSWKPMLNCSSDAARDFVALQFLGEAVIPSTTGALEFAELLCKGARAG
jgi:hypothetical protein